jgi:hypothetical protein
VKPLITLIFTETWVHNLFTEPKRAPYLASHFPTGSCDDYSAELSRMYPQTNPVRL